MKKIILTIIYPFWYLFRNTFIGHILIIPLCISPLPVSLFIFAQLFGKEIKDNIYEVAVGLSAIGLILSPIVFVILNSFNDYLEDNYKC